MTMEIFVPEKDPFKMTCSNATIIAEIRNTLQYVYAEDDKFVISGWAGRSWLFRVWPGGRKQVSMAGKELLK